MGYWRGVEVIALWTPGGQEAIERVRFGGRIHGVSLEAVTLGLSLG